MIASYYVLIASMRKKQILEMAQAIFRLWIDQDLHVS